MFTFFWNLWFVGYFMWKCQQIVMHRSVYIISIVNICYFNLFCSWLTFSLFIFADTSYEKAVSSDSRRGSVPESLVWGTRYNMDVSTPSRIAVSLITCFADKIKFFNCPLTIFFLFCIFRISFQKGLSSQIR